MSPDGTRVFITAFSEGVGTDYDYVTNAYDAEDGTEVWTARYEGPGSGLDIPWSLDVNADGTQVFVTGFSDSLGTGPHYPLLVLPDAQGNGYSSEVMTSMVQPATLTGW